MDDTEDERYAARLEEFRARMNGIALEAQKLLKPIDVAGSFIGLGHGVLINEFGPDLAKEYFAEMVTEMENHKSAEVIFLKPKPLVS